jgi:hypothetical protein
MNIDVVVKQPGIELPELNAGQMRYVLAGGGLFLERQTSMYTTCTQVPGPVAGLGEHGERCRLTCGPLPRLMTRAMLGFFRAAYHLHGGEAALILLYNPVSRTFRWHCPQQTVEAYHGFSGRLQAYDSIQYEMPLTVPEGYVIFGDAHSHGSLSAVPSGIDKHDESHKDGLHLIVGRLDRPGEIDYHADFVMDGRRFTFDPAAVLEDPQCEPFAKVPPAWLKCIRIKRSSPWSWSSGSSWKDDKDGWRRY